jgi:raffinose/stachyose/melibiose transport system permease protein
MSEARVTASGMVDAIPDAVDRAPTGRTSRVRPVRSGGLRKKLELAFLLTPATALFTLFVLAPIGVAAFYGFFEWDGFGPLGKFLGFQNYTDAFKGNVFHSALWHNVVIAGLSVLLQLPLSIGLAMLLNRRLKGRAILRLVVFAPYLLSEAITAVIWDQLLQPGNFIDQALRAVGLGSLVNEWLANTTIVLYTLFVVITWKYIGFGIILLLAGLQGVPSELREVAAIDGASSWQITRHVVLPLLGPTIRIWIFLSVIGSLQLFDLVWIVTGGGPANASATMATYIYDQGIGKTQYGYASAVAVILFMICFAFALVYQRFVLRRDTEGALTRIVG